jgi:hypothetical protein
MKAYKAAGLASYGESAAGGQRQQPGRGGRAGRWRPLGEALMPTAREQIELKRPVPQLIPRPRANRAEPVGDGKREMMAESRHRKDAMRFRALSESATDPPFQTGFKAIAEPHEKVADRLAEIGRGKG